MTKSAFVYVIYIRSTAEKVWRALTDGAITRQYWSEHRNASDWKVGSAWRHEDYEDPGIIDIVGTVVQSDRPHRLVVTWADPRGAENPAKHSRVTYDIADDGELVRFTLTHDDLEPGSAMERGISEGWPVVLSGLKTLLETGEPMPPVWKRVDGRWTALRFGESEG